MNPRSDLAALRARLAPLEGVGCQRPEKALSFGIAAIDQTLPWGGLRCSALHEIEGGAGTASGFGLALARLLAGRRGLVLWCSSRRATLERGDLYGPGLGFFGVAPNQLVIVETRTEREVLWAMEEGLRYPRALPRNEVPGDPGGGFAAVVGEVDPRVGGDAPMIASRRLPLAAETNDVTALLLTSPGKPRQPSAAVTRWRIAAAPGQSEHSVCPGIWRLELLRCRGGSAGGSWLVEWNDETCGFALAAEARDRPRLPQPSGMARPAVGDGRGEVRARLRLGG